jgi:Histidine kinase-, DNA gyrase B-, and HSP90-like ATPase
VPESATIPIVATKRLPPDPRSLEALGRHHSLGAALAELVDNAVDARAERVLIRFVKAESRLCRLLIVDDGVGMGDEQIDVAMTVGGARSYEAGEIGRFGLGLKAASFSQARSVLVISSSAGSKPVGRRWEEGKAKQDYICEVVDPAFARTRLAEVLDSPTGTLVQWDAVKAFPAVDDEATVEQFLQDALGRIRTHLGMTFHRIVEAGKIQLFVGVEEDGEDLGGLRVPPLNPFGYPRTGAGHWPKTLCLGDGRQGPDLHCHVWPARSNLEEFHLDGDLVRRQGFYCYYRDRLVQAGGWNGLRHADKQLNLARIAIDLDDDSGALLSLNPEKSGVEPGAEFGSGVAAARAGDGTTFDEFVEVARGVFKEGNRRRRVRQAVLPPGAGFPPQVRQAFSRELPLKDEDPVDVRWTRLPAEDFFEIDREGGVLWLNNRYRPALSGGRYGSLNDLPVLKSLLFLLMENIFSGQNLGPRDKDNIELWQAILTTAAEVEAS